MSFSITLSLELLLYVGWPYSFVVMGIRNSSCSGYGVGDISQFYVSLYIGTDTFFLNTH